MPDFPIARVKKPRRSPLRLRFLTRTLEKAFCTIGPVICRTLYYSNLRKYRIKSSASEREIQRQTASTCPGTPSAAFLVFHVLLHSLCCNIFLDCYSSYLMIFPKTVCFQFCIFAISAISMSLYQCPYISEKFRAYAEYSYPKDIPATNIFAGS